MGESIRQSCVSLKMLFVMVVRKQDIFVQCANPQKLIKLSGILRFTVQSDSLGMPRPMPAREECKYDESDVSVNAVDPCEAAFGLYNT